MYCQIPIVQVEWSLGSSWVQSCKKGTYIDSELYIETLYTLASGTVELSTMRQEENNILE